MSMAWWPSHIPHTGKIMGKCWGKIQNCHIFLNIIPMIFSSTYSTIHGDVALLNRPPFLKLIFVRLIMHVHILSHKQTRPYGLKFRHITHNFEQFGPSQMRQNCALFPFLNCRKGQIVKYNKFYIFCYPRDKNTDCIVITVRTPENLILFCVTLPTVISTFIAQ